MPRQEGRGKSTFGCNSSNSSSSFLLHWAMYKECLSESQDTHFDTDTLDTSSGLRRERADMFACPLCLTLTCNQHKEDYICRIVITVPSPPSQPLTTTLLSLALFSLSSYINSLSSMLIRLRSSYSPVKPCLASRSYCEVVFFAQTDRSQ